MSVNPEQGEGQFSVEKEVSIQRLAVIAAGIANAEQVQDAQTPPTNEHYYYQEAA